MESDNNERRSKSPRKSGKKKNKPRAKQSVEENSEDIDYEDKLLDLDDMIESAEFDNNDSPG